MHQFPERLQHMNIARILSYALTATSPFYVFSGALLDQLVLDPKLRQLTILRVTQRIEAQYAWIQHVALAKVVGVSEEQIHSLQQGGHVKDEPHPCYWAKKLIDTNVWYTGVVFMLACFYSGEEMHYGHRCQNTAGRSAWRHD
jgi:alkylhydroperoxidase family enzyme